VDPERVGHLLHLERPEVLDALLEEVHLVLEDLVRDAVDRAAPLLDRGDELAAGVHLPLDELAVVLRERRDPSTAR
jgi:hypothetical protein